jgi:hypothetical protein
VKEGKKEGRRRDDGEGSIRRRKQKKECWVQTKEGGRTGKGERNRERKRKKSDAV